MIGKFDIAGYTRISVDDELEHDIKRRQAEGEWICAAPYGYRVTKQKQFEIVPTEAEIVRLIFKLYNEDGWGYKKISNYLTDQGIPTPRMSEQMRREAEGEATKRKAKAAWAIVTVQGILDNDFYIGTLRQGKFTRAKINGKDVRRNDDEHIVIENHHQPIIDYRTFATAMALREKRTRSNYRGVKKYDNVYSGFLECGDCGSPMFAMSRNDLQPAYTCGTYHRRGLSGCTRHYIKETTLNTLLSAYANQILSTNAIPRDKSFFEILSRMGNGEKITERDMVLIINRILIYENHITIDLQPEVCSLLKTGHVKENLPLA